jgi:hypothetical protein
MLGVVWMMKAAQLLCYFQQLRACLGVKYLLLFLENNVLIFYHMVFGSSFKYSVFKTMVLSILQFFRVLKTLVWTKVFLPLRARMTLAHPFLLSSHLPRALSYFVFYSYRIPTA